MLEELKEMLKSQDLNIAIGIVVGTHLLEDKSALKVTANVWPEDRQVIASMSWDACGPEAGIYQFPVINDMVLIAFTENEDQAFIIRKLSSAEDKIPESAKDGNLVLRSLLGKKTFLTSDTKINIGKGDEDLTENLVLGQLFKTFIGLFLNEVKKLSNETATHVHAGNLGIATSTPSNKTAIDLIKTAVENLKTNHIDNDTILSDLAFTGNK